MKKIALIFLLNGFFALLSAQSDVHYSMFKLNRQIFNPAATGANDVLTFTSHYRDQWGQFPGAPRTFTLQTHSPFFNKKVGLGISLIAEEIGMLKINMVSASYAYHFKLPNEMMFSIGGHAQLEHGMIQWEKIDAYDMVDRTIGMETDQVKPNFGAGITLRKGEFYAGFSIPRFFKPSIFLDDPTEVYSIFALRTYYFQMGSAFLISKNFALQPGLLIARNPSAPFEFDFNINLLMYDRIGIGVAYRFQDSADAILQFKLNDQFKLAFGVDFTLSEFRQNAANSFEMLLQYELNFTNEAVHNIRFF